MVTPKNNGICTWAHPLAARLLSPRTHFWPCDITGHGPSPSFDSAVCIPLFFVPYFISSFLLPSCLSHPSDLLCVLDLASAAWRLVTTQPEPNMSESSRSASPSSVDNGPEAHVFRELLHHDYFPRHLSARAYVQFHVAEARRDPWIKPTDAKWKSVHDRFVRLLNSKKKTIREILMKNFTYHEAALFLPSDRPEIKELQDRHTARYNELRQGRFKDIVPSVSTKLTMLYFGVSVEPMQSPLDELAMAIDEREPDGPQIAVAPPLHFLTAHKHRNWGDDAKRSKSINVPPHRE